MKNEDILEWYQNLNEERQNEAIVVSYTSSSQNTEQQPDHVMQRDGNILREAYGLAELIKNKIDEYAQHYSSDQQYYMERQQAAKELKKLVEQLSQMIGEL